MEWVKEQGTLLLKTMSSGIIQLGLLLWVILRIHIVEKNLKKVVEKCPYCTEREKGVIIGELDKKGLQEVENIISKNAHSQPG